MQGLQIIIGISFFIMVITLIVQHIYMKGDESFAKKPLNWVLHIITYITIFIIIGCGLYMRTDTLKDFIITFMLAAIIIAILGIHQLIQDKIGKYVLLTFVVSQIAICVAGYLMVPFLLVEFSDSYIFAMLGALIGSTINGSKYRKQLILISIVMFIACLFIFTHYSSTLKELNKPARYAKNYIGEQGYTLGEKYYIMRSSHSNKGNMSIKISFISIGDDKKIMRIIDVIYYDDKIQEMDVDERALKID